MTIKPNLLTQPRLMIFIWVVLVLSTLGSWLESSAISSSAMAIIIGLAALKVILVIHYYMEINQAARWLKLLCTTWVSLTFSMILICYLHPEVIRQFV